MGPPKQKSLILVEALHFATPQQFLLVQRFGKWEAGNGKADNPDPERWANRGRGSLRAREGERKEINQLRQLCLNTSGDFPTGALASTSSFGRRVGVLEDTTLGSEGKQNSKYRRLDESYYPYKLEEPHTGNNEKKKKKNSERLHNHEKEKSVNTSGVGQRPNDESLQAYKFSIQSQKI